MTDIIPVNIEDTNAEVLAMIVKATSRKYDCSIDIDFQNGNRKAEFIGDESLLLGGNDILQYSNLY